MTQYSLTDPLVVLSILAPFLFIVVVRFVSKNKQLTKQVNFLARSYPVLWGFTVVALAMSFLFLLVNALSIIFWNWNI
jgi:hypothetical protein